MISPLKTCLITLAIALITVWITACGGGSSSGQPSDEQATRPFLMGFTPWPYEASVTAIDVTYQRLHQHGDIIKHHLSDGIPWQEALDESSYDANVEGEITGRLSNTLPGMNVFLAIDSLNLSRNDKPLYWNSGNSQPLTEPWLSRTWNSTEVINAYVNFALDMIERFQPLYFEYGTEVSELILNDLSVYSDYLIFAEAVYNAIKVRHPELPLVTSIAVKSPRSTEATLIETHYPSILPFTDIVGISIYPYIFFQHADKGDPSNLPTEWLSQINNVRDGKPVAISETGWAAQNIAISAFSVDEQSDFGKQNEFTETMLMEAALMNAEFVIWWTATDFDVLWNDTLAQDPVARIWRDIGMYGEDQIARPALDTWSDWLSRQRAATHNPTTSP